MTPGIPPGAFGHLLPREKIKKEQGEVVSSSQMTASELSEDARSPAGICGSRRSALGRGSPAPGGRVGRAAWAALLVKNPPPTRVEVEEAGFSPWVGEIPWRRAWQSASVL